ncbi:MAG: asparaginase [Phycisphaerales bacterium]|nr:asparaginase [Phycisphaerales bacterium]
MTLPRILFLSLGGTITMVPDAGGGITPQLGAAELVASIPELARVAQIEARSPMRLPSPSLSLENLVNVAAEVEQAFRQGFDAAVVIQGTDTIEESAFLLDLLVGGDKPVVVTGAMRGADAPGADGPANLLAAARIAASPDAHGQGVLVTLNYDIHSARFVQKMHTTHPSAFESPLTGPLGVIAEGRARFYTRVTRMPCHPVALGPPPPVPLIKIAMGTQGRLLAALPDLGYQGVVLEGLGAGHVPAEMAPVMGEIASRIPVVLASRCTTGPVFTSTYGYPGGEIDLIKRGLIPAGFLSGLKARLLLGLALRSGPDHAKVRNAFEPYQ